MSRNLPELGMVPPPPPPLKLGNSDKEGGHEKIAQRGRGGVYILLHHFYFRKLFITIAVISRFILSCGLISTRK